MTSSINIKAFPFEHKKVKDMGNENGQSEETRIICIVSCGQINELEEKIKTFKEENKYVQEKEKKIIIHNFENEEDDNEEMEI